MLMIARLAVPPGIGNWWQPALGMVGVGEDANVVEVLARGDEAHGEGLAHHGLRSLTERPHALHDRVSKASLEELCRERGDAAFAEQGLDVVGDGGVHAV